MKPSLREMQATFWQLMLQGEAPSEKQNSTCARWFCGSAGLSAGDRLGIHAGMYAARLMEAMATDFAQVRDLLGEQRFHALVRSYLQSHPPQHFSIGRLGVRFPAALALAGEPDAADVANLAVARMQVGSEVDKTPARLSDLGHRADVQTVRLHFVPAMRVFVAEHDVVGTWRCLDAGPKAATEPQARQPPRKTTVVVWRATSGVLHTTLQPAEAAALRLAISGCSLGRICEAFAEEAEPEAAALQALSAWFTDGWVAKSRDGGYFRRVGWPWAELETGAQTSHSLRR